MEGDHLGYFFMQSSHILSRLYLRTIFRVLFRTAGNNIFIHFDQIINPMPHTNAESLSSISRTLLSTSIKRLSFPPVSVFLILSFFSLKVKIHIKFLKIK